MKTQTISRLTKRKSAFTLIEIMVATVIMVVLVGLVIQITSEVLKVWNRSTGKLSANAEARIALDILTQDLETAVFRNNGQQWLRADKAIIPGVAGLDSATVALSLFSPALDRPNGPGDICGISYRLGYVNPIDGTSSGDDLTFVLYRLVVSPKDTFEKLMGDPAQNVLPDGELATTEWKGLGGFTASIKGDEGSNYLVSNIVNFEIDFYVVDDGDDATTTLVGASPGLSDSTRVGCGLPNPSAENGGATVGKQAYSWAGTPTPQLLAYRQPLAYAEIKLTVISDEGMKLLRNLDKGRNVGYTDEAQDGSAGEQIVLEHGEVYTRRVNFLAQPL